MNNLRIWEQVCTTDEEATKKFKKTGGFRGTSIEPVYQIQRATQMWGPMGDRWGIEITGEKLIDLPFEQKLHYVYIKLWYFNEENKRCEVPQVGQTMMVYKAKDGLICVEEAPKMSLTDALTKALSWLGFSADIWLGEFDGDKRQTPMKNVTSHPASARGLNPEEMNELLKSLNAQIIEKGADSGKLLAYYGVSDTDELSAEQIHHALEILRNRK